MSPEQITTSLSLDCLYSSILPHSLSEDSDPSQEDTMRRMGTLRPRELIFAETAEPQFSCLHSTADAFWLHSFEAATGLHCSLCFTSSAPEQRLVPPTNFTSSDSVQRQEIKEPVQTRHDQSERRVCRCGTKLNTFIVGVLDCENSFTAGVLPLTLVESPGHERITPFHESPPKNSAHHLS